MRRLIFALEAELQLNAQIDYLIDNHARQAAHGLRERAYVFLTNTLCMFPGCGSYISERDAWETWIPRTKLVVWYCYDDEAVTILKVWHSSQDRSPH